MTGTIKHLRIDKGFGFIAPNGPGEDLFFHVRQLVDLEWNEQLTGMRVEFDEATDPRSGRLRAENVRAAN
jgi:cold shock CspA family protein